MSYSGCLFWQYWPGSIVLSAVFWWQVPSWLAVLFWNGVCEKGFETTGYQDFMSGLDHLAGPIKYFI
jgi:hypothetical protein